MKNLLLLLILFCFLATQKVFSQQPGTLDLTFGDNGISQTGMDDNDQTIQMQIDDLDRIYLSHYRNFSAETK